MSIYYYNIGIEVATMKGNSIHLVQMDGTACVVPEEYKITMQTINIQSCLHNKQNKLALNDFSHS